MIFAALCILWAGRSLWFWYTRKPQIYIALATTAQEEMEKVNDDYLDEVEDLVQSRDKFLGEVSTRRHRGSFRNYLVRCGQAKFGCPTRTEANRLVVRKYLYDTCVEAGLVARHIVDHLDIATELVFVPSKQQLVAAAIRHTATTISREREMADLRGQSPRIA